jgi:hypothetical protein
LKNAHWQPQRAAFAERILVGSALLSLRKLNSIGRKPAHSANV